MLEPFVLFTMIFLHNVCRWIFCHDFSRIWQFLDNILSVILTRNANFFNVFQNHKMIFLKRRISKLDKPDVLDSVFKHTYHKKIHFFCRKVSKALRLAMKLRKKRQMSLTFYIYLNPIKAEGRPKRVVKPAKLR